MAIHQGLDGLMRLTFNNSLARQWSWAAESTQSFDDHVWEAEDGLTWTHGRHTFKFGGQWWRDIIKTFYAGNNGELGLMDFDGSLLQPIPRLRERSWRWWSGFCARSTPDRLGVEPARALPGNSQVTSSAFMAKTLGA